MKPASAMSLAAKNPGRLGAAALAGDRPGIEVAAATAAAPSSWRLVIDTADSHAKVFTECILWHGRARAAKGVVRGSLPQRSWSPVRIRMRGRVRAEPAPDAAPRDATHRLTGFRERTYGPHKC